MLNHQKCGGYVFNAHFDSGNLASVELVSLYQDTSASDHIICTEFNLKTKPDCAGTLWENQNRSWFFFSIHGGEPNKICKLNVTNMNKQAKLFGQGMHPVMRVGETGKWERVKENPVSQMNGDQFCMSFMHKPNFNTPPSVRHYYAFTYPFTYTECQQQLDAFAEAHQKSTVRVNYVIQRLLAPVTQKSHAVEVLAEPTDNGPVSPPPASAVGSRLSRMSRSELETEIYYHRELLIHSVEGRRVDLLTITSFAGIQLEREPRLPELFPDTRTVRCNRFRGKTIIFMSSRVHPGETPASHVLNGFLKLLLDAQSLVGAALRQQYVFKIVPFLNPDGVYQGCYRSDTLGHNLNRVYQTPSLQTQPTIYAVRRLLRYYHFGADVPETWSQETSSLEMETNSSMLSTEAPKAARVPETEFKVPPAATPLRGQQSQLTLEEILISSNAMCNTDSSNTQSSDSECSTIVENPSCVLAGLLPPTDNRSDNSAITCPSTTVSDQLLDMELLRPQPMDEKSPSDVIVMHESPKVTRPVGRIFHDKLLPVIQPIHIAGAAGVHPKKPLWSRADQLPLHRHSLQLQPHSAKQRSSTASARSTISGYPRVPRDASASAGVKGLIQPLIASKFRITKRRNTAGAQQDFDLQNNNGSKSPIKSDLDVLRNGSMQTAGSAVNNNLFLYIDLHGHASKKGIFMYGNHLPDIDEAVECMMLPRLMAMNSHHFHFDSCVFSEKNMYSTGKRDGLSKEGSGRVSMYKATGLIKCYTLEGNYNTGKYVNVLPPRGKEPTARKSNLPVPKYSPQIFEEVGRALGPSILDLTGSNPLSRLQNSDFKTVQGLRNALRVELERTTPRALVFNSAAPGGGTKTARLKSGKKVKAKAAAAAAAANVASKSAASAPAAKKAKKQAPMPAAKRHSAALLQRPYSSPRLMSYQDYQARRQLTTSAASAATASSSSSAPTGNSPVLRICATSESSGPIVVGKRKGLKVRTTKSTATIAAAGSSSSAASSSMAVAASSIASNLSKPLKRVYTSKDSLRLKQKKKKKTLAAATTSAAAATVSPMRSAASAQNSSPD